MTSLALPSQVAAPRPVITVTGPVDYRTLGIVDAHNHLWISPVAGADPDSPVLDQFAAIRAELVLYREKGGGALLDCQPGGFGRDGGRLRALADATGVKLIASTGFHRRKYNPAWDGLWDAGPDTISDLLCAELQRGLQDSGNAAPDLRAGCIKIALEATWEASPRNAIDGAAAAALETHALMLIHTEKGALAERACAYFMDRGLSPIQLVLCHMDKRPDTGLHKALADTGAMLEYDTFHRPKYRPEENLWPLLEQMTAAGYADRIALATDMAEAQQYKFIGGGPGLASLPGEIRRQLGERGFPQLQQTQLLGGNIARRLAGLS